MDKKLRKDILKILRDEKANTSLYILESTLKETYNYKDEGKITSSLSPRVLHILRVLKGESLISMTEEGSLVGFGPSIYIELTAKGYTEANPWYKKIWGILNDDLTKILSLISLILSILATIISLWRR
jgi:hypothetical protein